MKAFPLALGFLLFAAPSFLRAQWLQQTNQLKPGWNAVFLEVHPEPQDCDILFAGLPVESVWDFNRLTDSPQFVQDPSTLLPGSPGWLTWFPTNHPLAGQGNLFILRDGRPYLIKLADNAQPVNWIVTGRPSLRQITWRAGGVNLVGFHVGSPGPTFQSLFAGETGLAGQPVYSLTTDGVWQAMASLSTARPVAREAYWINCRSPAERAGTIQVDAGSRRGLSFAGGIAEQNLRVRNMTAAARNISLRLLPSASPPVGQAPLAGPVPLEYWRADYVTKTFSWVSLPLPMTLTALPAGQEWNIRLGARTAGVTVSTPGAQFQSLLEVTDDLGARWLVPVNADPSSGSLSGAGLRAKVDNESPHAGLWIGEAVLHAVSEPAHPGDSATPRPSGGEFPFRLIVHVNGNGAATLLQHVYLVRKPPTFVPDPENPGFNIVDQPSRTIVVTDEALMQSIVGPGQLVGRRISSAAFAFKQPALLTGGSFGDPASAGLNGAILLDYDDPLNPFKHRFHPDHNSLDERFEQKLPEGKESFTVTRSLSFVFTANDPLGTQPPGWGDSEVGGTYRETIGGLHRSAIHIKGSFRLMRVARSAALNE